MKIAFLGTSEFSKIVLESLHNSNHQVVCIVTNLDKESGRWQKVKYSAVKQFGLDNNIPVLQYKSISREGEEDIKKYKPDVLVTASFGQILKENILNLAPKGVINVHTSLLPQYRGSCPVNWTIIKGEKLTGVTIMQTNIGLDTGDIILQKTIEVLPDETAGELTLRLASLGSQALLQALELVEQNKQTYTVQDEKLSSYYPMLNKDMGKIDFGNSAKQIQNLCNGLNPWPLCFVYFNAEKTEKLKVFKAKPFDNTQANQVSLQDYKNGQVVYANAKTGLVIKCEDGLVLLDIIQAPNSKAMSSKAYLNGKTIEVGKVFE